MKRRFSDFLRKDYRFYCAQVVLDSTPKCYVNWQCQGGQFLLRPGNALERVQRVHAPADLLDITFCTRRISTDFFRGLIRCNKSLWLSQFLLRLFRIKKIFVKSKQHKFYRLFRIQKILVKSQQHLTALDVIKDVSRKQKYVSISIESSSSKNLVGFPLFKVHPDSE